ncbi:UNVERIFIED_CONTAM: EmrB/QacA subfamily drug resistance transporter [Brevibacillus sp. OAP136]
MAEQKQSMWLVLIAIILGTFVAVLNNSLINVALPQLVNVFGSDTQTIQWVLTGYMLSSAVVIPMSGFLGGRFGNKFMFVGSLIAFMIGSLLCGLAWSDSSLIFFRVLQGLGGGLIMPIGMTFIYASVPREKIGMALGLWGVAAMAAPAIGPTLGGYLIDIFSWRLLFLICVPVALFAIVMCSSLLRETPKNTSLKLDKAGAILSVIACGSLLFALSKGQSEGWTSFYIVSFLLVAVFSLILFIWVELHVESPLLDLRLFKITPFTVSVITASMVMMGMMGGTFLMPLYLQNIQGLTPMQSGLLLMPQSIAMALMMPISGRLFDKFGVIPLGLVGLTVMGVTTVELHNLAQDTPNHWLDVVLTIRGIGIGLCMMPLSTVGMNSVPKHMVGLASPLSNVIRQVFASFGIALLTAVMQSRQTSVGASINDSVSVTNDAANSFITTMAGVYQQSGVDAATAKAGAMTMLGGLIQKEAAVRAIADTFLVSAIPIFISIPLLIFFVKRKKPAEATEQGAAR